MSAVLHTSHHIPGTVSAVAVARQIGDFLYGDQERTRRSLIFGYLCISVYTLAMLGQSAGGGACSGMM